MIMSDLNDRPTLPPAPRASPDQRNGCLTAFMILVGIILLLPGALHVMLFNVSDTPIGSVALLVALGGGALIAWAILRKR